jgi:hypothetical protein
MFFCISAGCKILPGRLPAMGLPTAAKKVREKVNEYDSDLHCAFSAVWIAGANLSYAGVTLRYCRSIQVWYVASIVNVDESILVTITSMLSSSFSLR